MGRCCVNFSVHTLCRVAVPPLGHAGASGNVGTRIQVGTVPVARHHHFEIEVPHGRNDDRPISCLIRQSKQGGCAGDWAILGLWACSLIAVAVDVQALERTK